MSTTKQAELHWCGQFSFHAEEEGLLLVGPTPPASPEAPEVHQTVTYRFTASDVIRLEDFLKRARSPHKGDRDGSCFIR